MSETRRNIELKARLRHRATAHEAAESLADRPVEVQSQCDTYFHCRHGRLKLREIDGRGAQLIWYDRADLADAKPSNYRLADVADGESLKATLAAALGVRAVVRKNRRVYWHRNVRIHLDEVDSLGSFLEFEAVIADSADSAEDAAARQLVAELLTHFDLRPDDLLRRSYGDMLAAADGDCGA